MLIEFEMRSRVSETGGAATEVKTGPGCATGWTNPSVGGGIASLAMVSQLLISDSSPAVRVSPSIVLVAGVDADDLGCRNLKEKARHFISAKSMQEVERELPHRLMELVVHKSAVRCEV